MNKKFILVISSSILLITACNNNAATPDAKTIANDTYELLVNSAKDSNAFALKNSISSDKLNVIYKHNYSNASSKNRKSDTYTLNFNNVDFSSSLALGGLKEFTVDQQSIFGAYNDKLVSELSIGSFKLNGNIKDDTLHGDDQTTTATLTLDNLESSGVKGYINHNVTGETTGLNYYGAYMDYNTVGEQLNKIKVEGNDEMKKQIEEFAESIKGDYKKSYVSLKNLPILPITIEGALEYVLGTIGQEVTNFGDGKYDETKKTELINEIATDIEALTAAKVFTYSKNGNVLKYAFTLDATLLNKFVGQEVVKEGKYAVTIESDSNKRLSKIDLQISNFKTTELPISVKTSGTSVEVMKSLTFNDTNLKLSFEADYSTSYDNIKKNVDDATSKKEDWRKATIF